MDIKRVFSNIGLYSLGVVLSCGPSQVYGLIKGAIDLTKYAKLCSKIAQCKAGDPFSKRRVVELTNALKRKEISLKTDLVAMIPLVGALFAWRVMAPKGVHTSLDAVKGIPFATAHMLEDHHSLLRTILYPLGSSTFQARYNKQEEQDLKRKAEKKNSPIYRGEKAKYENNRKVFSRVIRYHELLSSLGIKVEKISTPMVSVKIPVDIRHTKSGNAHLAAYEMIHTGAPKPTVVLFHGNAMTARGMKRLGKFYFRLGFNVLMPTMGGYPGSSPCPTSEATSLQDVEAIKKYLLNKGVTQVGYHGLSIGGSVAFQAAASSTKTNKMLKTLFLVADQTFTSAEDVFVNTVKNTRLHLGSLAKGVALTAVPKGEKVQVNEDEFVYTDGLDNLSKAKTLKEQETSLITIEASRDFLMKDLREKSRKEKPENLSFANRLLSARYENEKDKKEHFIELKYQGHATPIAEQSFSDEQMQLIGILRDFLPPKEV